MPTFDPVLRLQVRKTAIYLGTAPEKMDNC